jgi:hypothetical protein
MTKPCLSTRGRRLHDETVLRVRNFTSAFNMMVVFVPATTNFLGKLLV